MLVEVRSARTRPTRRRRLTILEAKVADETGVATAVWFNRAWLAEKLTPGTRLLARGKLEKRGWVERSRSETSGRVKMVTMTDKGYQVLVEAAPSHVEFVHSLIYDGLTDEDVASLKRLMTHVLDRIEASGLKSSC